MSSLYSPFLSVLSIRRLSSKPRRLPLQPDDREQFIIDDQEVFNYGAIEEFGLRDDHFEEDEQIISRATIEHSTDSGEAYRIVLDVKKVGDLDILFVSPKVHSKGIGYAA